MGALATAGLMLVLVMAPRWLFGAPGPRPFSWRGFALMWLLMALFAALLGWWERRRTTGGETGQQPGVPRVLRVAGAVADVVWLATAVAASGMAFESEMPLRWAALSTALAFAPMGVVWHLTDRYETEPAAVDPEPSR